MFRKALAAGLVLVAACGAGEAKPPTTEQAPSSTTAVGGDTTIPGDDSSFPVTVSVVGGEITMDQRPERIVSLSPTATETLFAIGAGDQVIAVDEFSNYPSEAPITALSGYTPNIEAIAGFEPDLIVVAFDPDGLITDAFEPQGAVVVTQFPAVDRSDLFAQIEQLGALTGHLETAVALTSQIQERWDSAVTEDAGGATIYVELDPQAFFAASSHSFLGGPLAELGFVNIADAADPTNSGFPQMTAEAIIEASPDVILVSTESGTTPEAVKSRPGWQDISAVAHDRVYPIDSDISSRWGPRFVEYVEYVAQLAASLVGEDA